MNPARAPFRRDAAVALLLAVLALLVYANTLGHGFVWDDEQIVVNNPDTRDLSRLGSVLLSPDETAPYYRPLNRGSYLVDHALFGMNPAAFHAENVLLHALGVLLLYALVRVLGGTALAAATAAALLAVHPLHAEAVNFVTARNNLFALDFSLAAVIGFALARTRGARWWWLSAAALLLALLSKEQGLMALGVIGAMAWRDRAGVSLRTAVPYALALAVYGGLRAIALAGHAAPAVATPGLGARLAQTAAILPRYLGLVLWPAGLTIFHVLPKAPLASWWLVPAWLAIAVVGVALARLAREDVVLAAGLLWLVLNVIPIANLVPIPSAAMAERYVHVPLVGLWMVAGALVARAASHVRRPIALVAVPGIIVLAALGVRTIARNRDWRTDELLYRSAIAADPRSVDAHVNLGDVLKDRGDLAGAKAEWESALRIDPDAPAALTQLGTLAAVGGDVPRAEALYRRALASGRAPGLARYNLARLCEQTGRGEEAARLYREFLGRDERLYAGLRPLAQERLRALGGAGRAPR